MNQSSELLQNYFRLKCEKQPQFSLRQLAKRMEISPSYLSRILNGQKLVPSNRVQQFIEALEIDDTGESHFRRTLLVDRSLDEETQKAIEHTGRLKIQETTPSESFTEVSGKKYALLEEWYYIPLLDLVSCEGFSSDPEWIADRLGLKVSVAEKAWKRLLNLKCVEFVQNRWQKVDGNIRVPTTKTHPSIRKYHQCALKKAFEEISTKTTQEESEKRCFKTASVAGNKKSFAKAKKILDDALFEAIEVMREDEPNEVFQLAYQVFPLTD